MIETPDIILPPNWSLASCVRCLYSDGLLSRLRQLEGASLLLTPSLYLSSKERKYHPYPFFSVENTPFFSLPSPSKCINPTLF